MLKTILFLILTLIILPVVAFYYDTPLSPEILNALYFAAKVMLGVALTCFLLGEITGNTSQVDKIWSIIPAVYLWIFAWKSEWNPRIILMAVVITIWAIRLTYNFARRGGYHWIPWKGEEDYRWAVLRQKPGFNNRFIWAIFNLFFISLYQNSLLLLITLPALVAWQGADTALGAGDFILAGLILTAVTIEFIADQQQYDFQTEKFDRINQNLPLTGDLEDGFCQRGLWKWVRHPNYTAEQSVWFFLYFFSVVATGRWVNWSLAGVILLMLLFMGSSDMSEKISSGKYPKYADYIKRVPRFIPRFGGPPAPGKIPATEKTA
ncbi:DUF1295 domain-containing protein [bacterium SCSIO 12741]|nr:DUF1295 domain-containing protein [bacterium SCSIO 12741]